MQEATVLDTSGLLCPEPIMLLHQKVEELSSGDQIHLIATDPASQRDVEKFCRFLPHQLERSAIEGEVFHFWIQVA